MPGHEALRSRADGFLAPAWRVALANEADAQADSDTLFDARRASCACRNAGVCDPPFSQTTWTHASCRFAYLTKEVSATAAVKLLHDKDAEFCAHSKLQLIVVLSRK